MKKAFIIIVAISLMLCFCVSVSAAETTYRIEEGKMSLQLPDSWVVYTRDMPKEDANIAAYYTNHTEMIAYMEKYKVYMEALPNEKMMIGIKIWPAEELSSQFRELLGTEDKIEREKKLTDMMDNAPAGDVQLVGLYESNPGGSNNWLYLENTVNTDHYVVEQYVAVVGDKAVFVYGVPTEDYMLSADNKAILEQVLGKIVYDKSIMTSSSPAPKQETTPQSPSQQDSFANQNNQTTARTGLDMRTILLIGLAVVVVSVVAIVGMKLLRKKESPQGNKIFEDSEQNRRESVSSHSKEEKAPPTQALSGSPSIEQKKALVAEASTTSQEVEKRAFCTQCGTPLSEGTNFCGKCGAKVQ